jgi:integrase
MQRPIERLDEGISKDITRKIINACDTPRLRTHVMFLAATGWRPREVAALKWSYFDFNKGPVVVKIPGEKIKMKRDRKTTLLQSLRTSCYYGRPITIEKGNMTLIEIQRQGAELQTSYAFVPL